MRFCVSALSIALLCGCASSGAIRGTLSASSPGAESADDSGRVSAVGSIHDAVVYVEPRHVRGEPIVPAVPTLARLELKDQEFRPRILAVPVGSTVEFTNNDSLYHDVFSVSPARRFELGRCGGGKTRRVTFERAGLVKIYCNLHPNMAAYVLVVPSRTFARPDSLGRFVLPRLPKGKYVVNVWHPDFPVIRREVTVSGGEDAEVLVTLGS